MNIHKFIYTILNYRSNKKEFTSQEFDKNDLTWI